MGTLLSRFSERRPTPADAEGILAVGIARDIEDLGYPDYSLDDVREQLSEPGVDLDRDAWVVDDEAGRIVASALLTGGDARVFVHPEACGAGVGSHLRERLEERARERGEPVVRQYIGGANDGARRLLERAGYSAEQRYRRLVRELDGDLPDVRWPAGVRARPYEPGTDDAAAHALVSDAFADIPGNVERSLEAWVATEVRGAQFDAGVSTVALAGDELAGVALCVRWEGGRGHVGHLAVARAWRGRGLGRALLAGSLANMRAAGLGGAALGVNDGNRPAKRLYESAGMRVSWRAERYEKRLG